MTISIASASRWGPDDHEERGDVDPEVEIGQIIMAMGGHLAGRGAEAPKDTDNAHMPLRLCSCSA